MSNHIHPNTQNTNADKWTRRMNILRNINNPTTKTTDNKPPAETKPTTKLPTEEFNEYEYTGTGEYWNTIDYDRFSHAAPDLREYIRLFRDNHAKVISGLEYACDVMDNVLSDIEVQTQMIRNIEKTMIRTTRPQFLTKDNIPTIDDKAVAESDLSAFVNSVDDIERDCHIIKTLSDIADIDRDRFNDLQSTLKLRYKKYRRGVRKTIKQVGKTMDRLNLNALFHYYSLPEESQEEFPQKVIDLLYYGSSQNHLDADAVAHIQRQISVDLKNYDDNDDNDNDSRNQTAAKSTKTTQTESKTKTEAKTTKSTLNPDARAFEPANCTFGISYPLTTETATTNETMNTTNTHCKRNNFSANVIPFSPIKSDLFDSLKRIDQELNASSRIVPDSRNGIAFEPSTPIFKGSMSSTDQKSPMRYCEPYYNDISTSKETSKTVTFSAWTPARTLARTPAPIFSQKTSHLWSTNSPLFRAASLSLPSFLDKTNQNTIQNNNDNDKNENENELDYEDDNDTNSISTTSTTSTDRILEEAIDTLSPIQEPLLSEPEINDPEINESRDNKVEYDVEDPDRNENVHRVWNSQPYTAFATEYNTIKFS